MASYNYDLIVIGSGAAGSVAARQAAKAGKSVALIEAGTLGGDCPNSEVPRYALLEAAHTYYSARQAIRFGVRSTALSYNYPSLLAWQQTAAKRAGSAADDRAYTEAGITVIHGHGHLLDPHTVSVGGARLTAGTFLLATGASAPLPTVPGLAQAGFASPREAINFKRVPKSLAILGRSVEAIELAELFAILGSQVYVISEQAQLVPEYDKNVDQLLKTSFAKEYAVTFLLETSLSKVTRSGLKTQLHFTTKQPPLSVDEVVVAGDRSPSVDMGLENAGVTYGSAGITVNRYLQTNVKHIFAAGACVNPAATTTLVTYHSRVAAHNVLHPRKLIRAENQAIVQTIFTEPQIAQVGLSAAELQAQKQPFKQVMTELALAARANISDVEGGFISLRAEPKTGRLLGATIAGPAAGELAAAISAALQNHASVQSLAHSLPAFGSWAEGLRLAAARWLTHS